MSVINTNVAASLTANAMKTNQRDMDQTMERLATGLRVNSAQDDAAGLAIGTRMDAQIRGLDQAARNANDGISLLQTVDSAASEMTDMFQRMRELAVQAQTSTLSTTDISNLNGEFAALAAEVDRLASDTTFNNISIMDGSDTSMSFAIGADETDVITVTLNDFNLANGGATVGEVVGSISIAAAESSLNTDLASGNNITFSDGAETIAITLSDVQEATGDASITAANATLEQIAAALNVAANANADFTAVFASTSDTGFIITEKAGKANSNDTYSMVNSGSGAADTAATIATTTAGSVNGALGADLSDYSNASTSSVNSTGTIAAIDAALDGISSSRATLGSTVARLEFTVNSLQSASLNNQAAKSRIMDADYAAETTELARSQIIAQASTAMLSQANQATQSVLALLK